MSLEAFAVTEFNEMFLGRQPLQDVKVFWRFRDWLCPLLQGVAWWLGRTKTSAIYSQNRYWGCGFL